MRSKTLLVILMVVTVALLGNYYFMGRGVFKQRHSNEALASQITQKSDELASVLKPSQDLDARLAEAEQNLADAVSSIPTDLSSTLIINDILKLANACGITVTPLTANPWVQGNKGYRVFRITMTLSGDFPEVYTFINQLESVEFKTFIIEGLSISPGNASSTEIQASLNLAIYSRYTSAN